MFKLRPSTILAATVLLAALLAVSSAQATPGDLDPSFGTGGKVTTPIGPGYDAASALALQPDGKLVAAGHTWNGSNDDFALARYNPDGSLDPGFGFGGKVTTAIGPSRWDYVYALALQPDGKIVAAGSSWSGNFSESVVALARYNPDGTLDPSFGTGGRVTTAIGPGVAEAYALALQPDGKLVAAGIGWNGSDDDFALARYNPDGSLDPSFGTGGKVTTAIGPSSDWVEALALQPDGKIVAAGYSHNGSDYDFALARYNPNGSLDPSFGSGGKVTTAIGPGQDGAAALALQPDGNLVAAGYSSNLSNFDVALARYNPDGSLDPSFGTGGKVTTAIGPGHDSARALALQPDGKLVAAGTSHNGSDYDVALVRYNPNGSLDTGFNGTGKVTTAIGPGNDEANALALQPDGKIVAAGRSYTGSNDDVALVRYLGSTLTVTKAGSGSGTVSSSPAGIDCGSTCSASFAAVPVTLTATAAPGSTFTGWSGACSGGGSCTLTMSGDRTATATFEAVKTLTVTKAGSGSGTVSSGPGGIDCGSTCSASFAALPVTLTATAAPGSTFTGWSGACSGIGACTVAMSADHTATATFESDKTLSVKKAGAGSGTVVSSPGGIECGASCIRAYADGAAVTLTARAAAGSTFSGWSGACSGTGSCILTMSGDRTATATFKPLCVVPKLKGKPLGASKGALKRAHCSLGTVSKAYSATVKKGSVIAQKPKPGTRLAAGGKVKLTLSKGKRP